MTKQLFHLTLFLLMYVSIPSTATAQTVAIPDHNLRAAVETALGKASGAPITAVEMATLTRLEARKSGIQRLTGLEHATKLTVLDLGGNNISDISPVAGLTNLTELWLWGNRISDISPVAGLTELQRLHLGSNNISDILPMINLTNLTQLWLWGNGISNILVVVILTRLQWLHLGGNRISDISPVAGLTNLTGLNLVDNRISDISPVAGLTNLTWLGLNNNNISDISAVIGLANLRQLWLVGNSISDISPLVENPGLGAGDIVDVTQNPLSSVSIHTHVPILQSRGVTVGVNELTSEDIPDRNLRAVIETALGKAPGAPITVGEMATLTRLVAGNSNIHTLTGLEHATNLTVLDLGGNSISDISPVAGLTALTWLGLNNNTILDLSPLAENPELGKGDRIDVTQNPFSRVSIYTHIPTLQSRGVTVQFDVPKPRPSAPATVDISEGGLTAQKVTEPPPPVTDETLQSGSESKTTPQTEPILVMDEPLADIGQSLVEIAQRASRQSTNQMVDIVFIVNWKMLVKRLDRRVEKFQRWIADMASVFDESMIDYRVTVIYFEAEASEVSGKPREKVLTIITRGWSRFSEKNLRFKGIVAREGLDAIMTGLTELKFSWEAERPFEDSEKFFIVMTHEALKTDWGTGRENELVEKIVDRCKQDAAQINVLGIDEEVQIQLANLTGGEWYEIEQMPLAEHGALAKREDLGTMSMPFLPKIDMIFERIAQHIAETVKQPVDIVFIFDSSLSMNDKVAEICTGLDTLVKVLDSEGLDSRFGVIRFWAAGGGRSSVTITRPPLNAEQVKKLFRRPKRGEAYLLDAIMEGVPKLQMPDDRKLVLIIVTDKLPSSGPGTGYTYTKAIEVVRRAGAQTNIIGAVVPLGPKGGVLVDADKFQRRITVVTNGKYYIIPGAIPPRSGDRNR